MSWGYGIGGSAKINYGNFISYEAALSFYEKVKPIRGTDVRPIGSNRRYKHCSIVKEKNGDIGCYLYNTRVVTYSNKGTITLHHDPFPTVSTASFIDAVLPPKFGICRKMQSDIVWSIKTTGETEWKHYAIPKKGLVLKVDDKWENITPVNPEPQFTFVLDRSELNRVKQKFSDFIQYLKVSSTMSNTYTSEEFIENFPEIRKAKDWKHLQHPGWVVSSFHACLLDTLGVNPFSRHPSMQKMVSLKMKEIVRLAKSTNANDWRKAALRLVVMHRSMNRLNSFVWRDATKEHKENTHPDMDGILITYYHPLNLAHVFYEAIKYVYKGVCFTRTPVALGVLAKKHNHKYFV